MSETHIGVRPSTQYRRYVASSVSHDRRPWTLVAMSSRPRSLSRSARMPQGIGIWVAAQFKAGYLSLTGGRMPVDEVGATIDRAVQRTLAAEGLSAPYPDRVQSRRRGGPILSLPVASIVPNSGTGAATARSSPASGRRAHRPPYCGRTEHCRRLTFRERTRDRSAY
jgi:hypothetical protein